MSRHLATSSEKREGSQGNPSFHHSLTFPSPLFLSSILTKNFSRDLLLVTIFKRRSSWLNTEHKGPTFLGFIARSRICFLVDHWTQKTNVFWVHCKKWVQLLGCYHWTQGTNVPWGSLQEVGVTS